MNVKQGIFVGVIFAFFVLGVLSMQRAMPNAKEDRIYKAIKVYSPYKFDKYVGGLKIIDSRDGRVEKPTASDVLLRMDELDQEWGKKHLKIVENDVEIIGENNQTMTKIFLQSDAEKNWVKKFYGI